MCHPKLNCTLDAHFDLDKWNFHFCQIERATSHQKLGIFLENKVLQNVNNHKIFLIKVILLFKYEKINFRKIQLCFDIDNWLLKLKNGHFQGSFFHSKKFETIKIPDWPLKSTCKNFCLVRTVPWNYTMLVTLIFMEAKIFFHILQNPKETLKMWHFDF